MPMAGEGVPAPTVEATAAAASPPLTESRCDTLAAGVPRDDAWVACRNAQVAARLAAVVERDAVSGAQRVLLQTALRGLDRCLSGRELLPFVHLPLLVHAAVDGREEPALALASVSALVYLGLDIVDDVADGDTPSHWAGTDPAAAPPPNAALRNLAGATLLCGLVPRLLSELDAPPAVRVRMQDTLADGLLRMSAGQQADLTHTPDGTTPEDVEAAAARKTGAEVATFARLAALLAGASEARVAAYGTFGEAMGTALQLGSECWELLRDPAARDLSRGAVTYPLALLLNRLGPRERAGFGRLLERARADEEARAQVRAEVLASGALRTSLVVVETHRARARRALAEAGALLPARADLERMAGQGSAFGGGNRVSEPAGGR